MKTYEIDEGIKLHLIQTDKFQSNILCILFREQLNKENVTKNALLPLLLEQGSKKYKDNKKINKQVDNMYGATFDIQTIKKGEEQILQFYFEFVNNEEVQIKEVLTFLYEIIYNTNIQNGAFNKNIFDIQKKKMKNRIQSEINNKTDYAKQKTLEISFEGEKFAINPLGYEKNIEKIKNEEVVARYKELLNNCNIDFIYQGTAYAVEILEQIDDIFNFKEKNRNYKFYEKAKHSFFKKESNEKLEIGAEQAILCMTVKNKEDKELNAYCMFLLSEIIGGSTNSLLFKKIREEYGLCYYIYSVLYTAKRTILIQCGTSKKDLNKTISNIKKVIKDIEILIDQEDLSLAKNSLIRQYKLIQDNNGSSINFYLTQYLNDLEVELDELIYKINDISLEEIIEMSKNILIDCTLSLE